MKQFLLLILCGLCVCCTPTSSDTKTEAQDNGNKESDPFAQIPQYVQSFNEFKTVLIQYGPSPVGHERLLPTKGFDVVNYQSEGRSLQAYIYKGKSTPASPKPAIVYFHGGWTLGDGDLDDCKSFIDAGFVVFAPSLRGENGNEGNYEFLGGEIKDAQEAVKWAANQPYVDKSRIYTFGHSMGGNISLFLTLFPDLPIRLSGGSSGITFPNDFKQMQASANYKNKVPFDSNNDIECMMRSNYLYLTQMQRNHYLYQGTDDNYADLANIIETDYINRGQNLKLMLKEVKGDHFSSLYPAIDDFLRVIKNK